MSVNKRAVSQAKKKAKEDLLKRSFSKEMVLECRDNLFDKEKDFYKDYNTEAPIIIFEAKFTKVFLGHREGRPNDLEAIKAYGYFGDQGKKKMLPKGSSNTQSNGAEEKYGRKKEERKEEKEEKEDLETTIMRLWRGAMREITILKDSCSCPNIINYNTSYFVNDFQGQSCIMVITEYAHHGDLFGIIKSENTRRKLQDNVRAYILHCIGNALQFLDSMRIIHRDVKPGNILINAKGEVKLADFELAAHEESLDLNKSIGTPSYRSPEMLRCPQDKSVTITSKSDIWALGLVGLELVAGLKWRLSLGTDARTATEKELTNVPGLQSLVLDCLREDPNKRCSAEDVLKHAFLQDRASAADLRAVLKD